MHKEAPGNLGEVEDLELDMKKNQSEVNIWIIRGILFRSNSRLEAYEGLKTLKMSSI